MAKLLPSRPFKLTCGHTHKGGSQVATVVKNLPANAGDETWVRSLSREDPSEGGMATHPSILTWRIPWTGDWQATVYRVPKSYSLDGQRLPPPSSQERALMVGKRRLIWDGKARAQWSSWSVCKVIR